MSFFFFILPQLLCNKLNDGAVIVCVNGVYRVRYRKRKTKRENDGKYPDENFDVVVAANVIHLLDEPYKALSELDRVCRKNGKIIIPTYMNKNNKGKTGFFATIIGKIGANFKRQFTLETYKQFIENAGYKNVEYTLVKGKIPCAVAVIKKIVQ